MPSFSVWYSAERPNYNINIDLRFPYSELINYNADSDFHVEKIRFKNLIQHVDYWGEGKVVCGDGIRGFSNCYNVNQPFQLVSSGPDVDRKIPNRIPVTNDEECDTSDFIEDNSVLTVTVAGARITSSCAKDIARVVNNDRGKVVVYGVRGDSEEIAELTVELRKKGLIPSPNAALPVELQGLTYYDSHVAFLNLRILRKAMADELYNNVIKGYYDTAVNITQTFVAENGGESITEIVTRLIRAASRNVMSFAYKLWHGDAKDIVRNNFPKCFQHIFNEDAVTIVNKRFLLPLRLADTDNKFGNQVWGDHNQYKIITSESVSWKIYPEWSSGDVTFKLYNIEGSKYMKLDFNCVDMGQKNSGDRIVLCDNDDDTDRRNFYLDPMVVKGNLLFVIINCEFGQGLNLDLQVTHKRHRKVWGHNGSMYIDYERFRWIIAAW